MKPAARYMEKSVEEIKALLDGGTLKVFSVARPASPDVPAERSGILAEFTFLSPAFGPVEGGLETPAFAANPVLGLHVGTPGFATAFAADGTAVADFSAGPGPREIKFSEVSCAEGVPVKLVRFEILPQESWPERPDYYNTKPRNGYPMPAVP